MATFPEPSLDELLWTVAIARIIFGSFMNIQAPPNLSPDELSERVNAGINDWGGVSPLTPDHVNPEASWTKLGHQGVKAALLAGANDLGGTLTRKA